MIITLGDINLTWIISFNLFYAECVLLIWHGFTYNTYILSTFKMSCSSRTNINNELAPKLVNPVLNKLDSTVNTKEYILYTCWWGHYHVYGLRRRELWPDEKKMVIFYVKETVILQLPKNRFIVFFFFLLKSLQPAPLKEYFVVLTSSEEISIN